jgi:hypothetical protein
MVCTITTTGTICRFNNGGSMLNGLWTPNTPLSYDFPTLVYRMKLLG